MIISASQSSEGYSTTTADLFVFRSGQIIHLGVIPTDWGNGGAAGNKSKDDLRSMARSKPGCGEIVSG